MSKSMFLNLPDECICLILGFLRPSQVRRVALTYNRRLYAIAQPFLKPLIKRKQDEDYFEALFKKTELYSTLHQQRFLEERHFTTEPISIPSNPSHHLEYLDLNDDLKWLGTILSKTDITDWRRSTSNWHADNSGLEKLITSAKMLNLTIPPSFVKFLQDDELTRKIPAEGRYIEIEPLLKIRRYFEADLNRPVDGYIFTWSSYQLCNARYTSMYLDTAGRHVILSSTWRAMSKMENEGEREDWLELTDLEKELGIDMIQSDDVDMFEIEDVDFEHWLVNHYYQARASLLVRYRGPNEVEYLPMPDHVKKHFYNVYTEKGRRMQ